MLPDDCVSLVWLSDCGCITHTVWMLYTRLCKCCYSVFFCLCSPALCMFYIKRADLFTCSHTTFFCLCKVQILLIMVIVSDPQILDDAQWKLLWGFLATSGKSLTKLEQHRKRKQFETWAVRSRLYVMMWVLFLFPDAVLTHHLHMRPKPPTHCSHTSSPSDIWYLLCINSVQPHTSLWI